MTFVLHLRASSGVYGAEQVVLNLASKMNCNDIGAAVCLFGDTTGSAKGFYEQCRNRGIDTVLLGNRRWLSFDALRTIRERIGREKAATVILHGHDVKSNLHAVIAGRLSGSPVVITQHGRTSSTTAMRLYEGLDRVVTGFADVEIQVSRKTSHEDRTGDSSDSVRVIENGVDTHSTKSLADSEDVSHHLRNASIVLGNFSRFTSEKDHASLLRAVGRLKDDGLNAELLLAGDGPLLEQTIDLAGQLGVSDCVHFLGFRSDIATLLGATDIYVSSSVTEGLPMVVLEAMAAGVAIVATSVGGLPTVLAGDCGMLVPPGDPGALAAAIAKLAGSDSARRAMGERAIQRVRAEYNVERQIEQYVELYRRLGEGAGKRC